MSHKLLLAINHPETENAIKKDLNDGYIVVGAVAYKEAIINNIQKTEADTLLITEELEGSIDFLILIKTLRIRFPELRIICILCEREEKRFLELQQLIALGVYDIIVKNGVPVADIISFIYHKHNFADVASFFSDVALPEIGVRTPQKEEPPKAGLLAGLFGGRKKQSAPQPEIAEEITSGDHEINVDTLRAALQEEADRKAQASVEEIAKNMAEQKTASLREEIAQLEKSLNGIKAQCQSSEERNFQLGKDLDAARKETISLKQELKSHQQTSLNTIAEYKERIESLQSTENPEWYKRKSVEWEAEKEQLEKQISELKAACARAKTEAAALSKAINSVDLSGTEETLIVLPEDPNDFTPSQEPSKTLLFVGTKHGVGNSTVALNTATTLATQGFKTIYLEFNRNFPITNQFFEFIDIRCGIDTAIQGLKQENNVAVDAAVIKPRALSSTNRALLKKYQNLPAALHFMLFTNAYLKNKGEPSFEAEDVKSLLDYLTNDLDYSYVVIDIQPDDAEGNIIFKNVSSSMDQIFFTCTQDPHSVLTTGVLLQTLNQIDSNLTQKVKFVINQYHSANELSIVKIAKWLHLSARRFSTLSDDRIGYLKAASNATPYVCNHGQYAKEFSEFAQRELIRQNR